MKFFGNIDAKADTKGRIFIPAPFRTTLQSLGDTFLILKKDDFRNCLILYPESAWNEELEKLRELLSVWNEEQQNIFRQRIFDIEILEIDSTGRVPIPKRYMQMAGISSDIRFLGMYDRIEIWSKANFEKAKMDPESFKRGLEKYTAQ